MKLKQLLESLYRSPFGNLMSAIARGITWWKQPFMIYGFKDPASSQFHKYTRLSDSVVILSQDKLAIADHVWVWHYSILDATEGLTIEEGCQIGAWVGIFTHGSQVAIRLYGREYVNVPNQERVGYTRGSVKIGAYSFVGAGAIILPNVTIGKGCIIAAGSVVHKDIPDCSIAQGNPARIIGSTKKLDREFLENEAIQKTYYDPDILAEMQQEMLAKTPQTK
ncbi:MAG: DapH/DapD/GlmU-related protein [Microcystaceae cyanobacterium]